MSQLHNMDLFLNKNYKSLLNKQRAYASFNDEVKSGSGWTHNDLFKELVNEYKIKAGTIFDPMAGYGTTIKYGIEADINTIAAEINLPAHLWQLLMIPHYNIILQKVVNSLIDNNNFPLVAKEYEISENYIGDKGLELLLELYEINILTIKSLKTGLDELIIEKLALAILLPFTMRLAAAYRGDIMHIKSDGGLAIFAGYQSDYNYYLKDMLLKTLKKYQNSTKKIHEAIYADSSIYDFQGQKFTHMFTSPPYPNRADYKNMFAVENYFIGYLHNIKKISFKYIDNPYIGTVSVKNRFELNNAEFDDNSFFKTFIDSFLRDLNNKKMTIKQKNAMKSYYNKYYWYYFYDLYRAYSNISRFLAKDFIGYIILSNNSARRLEVPVSDYIIGLWKELGFKAESIKSRELTHTGTKNPIVRGKTALQTEHVIKVYRGNV